MKNRTSLKLKGRFFKGDDPTTKIIDVSNFDLMEICEFPISFPDNPHGNIFHGKLHESTEMAQVISTSKMVNTEFENNDARPVIKPLDFTKEWRRLRKRLSDRQNRGEEDDIEFEQEGHTMTLRRKVEDAMNDIQQKTSESNHNSNTRKHDYSDLNVAAVSTKNAADEEENRLSLSREENQLEKASTPNTHQPANEAATSQIESVGNPFHFSNENSPENLNFQSQGLSNSDGFVPMPEAIAKHAPPENSVRKSSQKELDSTLQEAQSKGYEEGYRLGEEKALISVQDKIYQTIQEVQSIVQELEGLKSNILINAQENFQILCQAMMESLLHQQFAINPSTFQNVIQRAIDEAVPDDKFVIHVSPKAFDNLKDFADEKFLAKLKVDQDLKQHDFKIESNLTVVDGNISQIINDLLDEADTKLFDSPEKVS